MSVHVHVRVRLRASTRSHTLIPEVYGMWPVVRWGFCSMITLFRKRKWNPIQKVGEENHEIAVRPSRKWQAQYGGVNCSPILEVPIIWAYARAPCPLAPAKIVGTWRRERLALPCFVSVIAAHFLHVFCCATCGYFARSRET